MKSLSGPARIGFWLAVLLGIVDVVSVAIPLPDDGAGPPAPFVVAGVLLGLITLVAAVLLARTAGRAWLHTINATRILSALLFVPAFLLPNVPGWILAWGIATLVLTAVSVVLLYREHAPAAARTTEPA